MESQQERILIVGGYGAVGRIIAAELGDLFPGHVVVAGRNGEKARALAAASNGRIRSLQMDVTRAHQTPELLDGVALVIICLDLPDTRFAEMCLRRGIHYIDITAEDPFLQQMEALDQVARDSGSTAVLSVGLSPGITNLLAGHSRGHFDVLEQLDIHVLLGLGEHHGEAATRWTLRNLNATYPILDQGISRQVGSFTEAKAVRFPGANGHYTAYRFNLADQHVLARTMSVPVSSWLAFDPPWVTGLLALLRRSGLSRLLQYRWLEDAGVRLTSAMRTGSDRFTVQVEARGTANGRQRQRQFAVTGQEQSRATGLAAAHVATQLHTETFPAGVFHIEQLFAPLPFLETLTRRGLRFWDHPQLA
ncbi:MAG: saccharopine dehydrogenase NADP-binding domain-containing protein [Anaerolineae bacterium]|nr:saccharopine dehydrogenase NADP-binding domain-containing protein [Anaerolineae bacterium]